MTTVWIALRSGGAPVKRPLTYPKTASAVRVMIADTIRAVLALVKIMYGPSGMKPPAI
jgi:hypothetical protein